MSANREQVKSILSCTKIEIPPLYMPAIYEHKAFFLKDTPSNISRSADLLTRAILSEYELLEPDALTIGVDVYNLEAEAAGCTVNFYEGDDTSIPGIKPGNHIVKADTDFSSCPVPNPLKDGRMPINIETARRIRNELGNSLWVRGALSGPFSLAISLMGAEDFFLCCWDNPVASKKVLEYSTEIIKEFGLAYIDAGVELILFDSQASPELLSPKMYQDLVLPFTKELVEFFRKKGVGDVPLIIGGKTTRIIGSLIETGANNLLCDFTADWEQWSSECRKNGRALRRNIDPRFVETATPDEIYEFSKGIVEEGKELPGFIMGTAVVPYGTPTENLLAVKQACLDSS